MECLDEAPDAVEVQPSTLYTMQYIISSRVEKLYTFAVTEEVLTELERIVKRYRNTYVEKEFKSLEILETIIGVE